MLRVLRPELFIQPSTAGFLLLPYLWACPPWLVWTSASNCKTDSVVHFPEFKTPLALRGRDGKLNSTNSGTLRSGGSLNSQTSSICVIFLKRFLTLKVRKFASMYVAKKMTISFLTWRCSRSTSIPKCKMAILVTLHYFNIVCQLLMYKLNKMTPPHPWFC